MAFKQRHGIQALINNVYIFGLGAIGSNLALQLSKVYSDFTYHGFDYDKVEDRNLRTQAYFVEHLNAPKAVALQAVLSRHNKKIKYKPTNKKIEEKIIVPEKTLVLDCFDNPEARKLTKEINGSEVLHIGFSPEFVAEIIWNENYTVPGKSGSDIDICTLNHAGPFIHFVVNFAAMQIIEFIDNNVKNNFIITNKFKIKQL